MAAAPPPAAWGTELVLDLGGCDPDAIRSEDYLRRFATKLCKVIGMQPYGKPILNRFALHNPAAAGYTLVQLIETSSITAHFAESSNTAYVNVFSCRPFDTDEAARFVADYFGAEQSEVTVLIRGKETQP